MDVSVLVSWKTKFTPVSWTLDYCPFCDQNEAIRIEQATEVVAVWGIPVSKTDEGKFGRCDFCERQLNVPQEMKNVDLERWNPKDGLSTLAKILGVEESVEIPERNTENSVNSMLAAVKHETSINTIDLTFGISTGAILGGLIAFPLAALLYVPEFPDTDEGKFNFVFSVGLIGIAVGAILGGVWHAILKRGKLAKAKIGGVLDRYPLDSELVLKLSEKFGGVVQKSVLELRNTIRRK